MITLKNVLAIENRAIGGNAGAFAGTEGGGGFGGTFYSEGAPFFLIDARIDDNQVQGGQGLLVVLDLVAALNCLTQP